MQLQFQLTLHCSLHDAALMRVNVNQATREKVETRAQFLMLAAAMPMQRSVRNAMQGFKLPWIRLAPKEVNLTTATKAVGP